MCRRKGKGLLSRIFQILKKLIDKQFIEVYFISNKCGHEYRIAVRNGGVGNNRYCTGNRPEQVIYIKGRQETLAIMEVVILSEMWPETVIETDVLIIGGGIAGCLAAIRARELGVDVTLVEKGNTRRSGSAATGIDHCWAYIPPIHGPEYTVEDMVEDHTRNAGGFIYQDLVHTIASNSYQRILDLERFGVPMRDENGAFRLVKKIHREPSFVHFAGRDMKVKLTNEARKRAVRILNRVMVTDLLVRDGEIIGCMGVNTRQPEVFLFKAKSIVITTGSVFRLYRNPTGMSFNTGFPPSETGDGHAMAFRSGVELVNMEFTTTQTGPKNFQRCGRGSYVPGVLRNALGRPLGDPQNDMTVGTGNAMAVGAIQKALESNLAFFQEVKEGRGPIYMDCTANTPAQIDYIRWALHNEGNTLFLRYLEQEGIDLGKHPIEFTVYEPKLSAGNSGIHVNTRCETNIPGLYAAGDAIGGVKRSVLPGALTLGWIAGEQAAERSRTRKHMVKDLAKEKEVLERKELIRELTGRKSGATWQEAQLALQNIMDHYSGLIRSETLLQAGLDHISRLRQRMLREIYVKNPHDLYRTLEIFNLADIGEGIMWAALTRKESRFVPGYHFRADYPQQDDVNWRKFLAVKRDGPKTIVTSIAL